MPEYIDRGKALTALSLIRNPNNSPAQRRMLEAAIRETQRIPAADVELVKHGRWVWNPDGMDWGLGAWQCSECHMNNPSLPCDKKVNVKLWAASHFCACCGAKMDKGVG